MNGIFTETHFVVWLWIDKHIKLKYLHAYTHMCTHTHIQLSTRFCLNLVLHEPHVTSLHTLVKFIVFISPFGTYLLKNNFGLFSGRKFLEMWTVFFQWACRWQICSIFFICWVRSFIGISNSMTLHMLIYGRNWDLYHSIKKTNLDHYK